MKHKKMISSALLVLTCLLVISLGRAQVQGKETIKRTRQINVVYDDSGSMAVHSATGQYRTRWSEAKYALEVFAAMMSETDNMKIYPMTSYSEPVKEDKVTYSLKGSDKVDKRIETINKMNGDHGMFKHTPLGTVSAAGKALKKSKADERWLVILTDGEFTDASGKKKAASEVKNEIKKFVEDDSGINVAYIPISEEAKPFSFNSKNYTTVDQNMDILDQVKQVAKTVFNYQSIDHKASGSSYTVSPDIPVSKFIVFAQGKKVKVKDLTKGKDKISSNSVADVEVSKDTKYKPKTKRYPDPGKMKVASGLKGQVITYNSASEDKPFAAGDYTFDCNVSNVEVFFEPGVSVEAFITDTDGKELNISDPAVAELDAGKKTLHVKMMNPLTGEEIPPSSSKLLEGVELSMTLTDQDGKVTTYNDGELVDISEGEIEIFAKAKFKGNIEKISSSKALKVNPAKLSIIFSQPDGYEVDPFKLAAADIRCEVAAADGTAFTEADYKNAKIKLNDAGGLEWSAEYQGKGSYKLVPKLPEGKSVSDIDTAVSTLKVAVTIASGKITRSGKASTKIAPSIGKAADLKLKLTMPENRYRKKEKNKDEKPIYMFDARERGRSEKAPYILVEVGIDDGNGGMIPLSESEWKKGLKGFSFHAKQIKPNIFYRLVRILCHQKLDFSVYPGEKPSTYKLYLKGLTAAGVLPGQSELDVKLNITLDNHIKEKGHSSGEVTVKPVGFMVYVGRLLLIILGILAAITLIAMEINKPRLPRDLDPNTTAYLEKAGVPIKPPAGPQFSRKKIKYVVFPPMRPEERKVSMKYPQYLMPISFTIMATGNGRFVIKNIDDKFRKVKNRVLFNGRSYDEVSTSKNGFEFSKNSYILVEVSLGSVKGEAKLTFSKPKGSETKRKSGLKKKKKGRK